MRSIIDFIRRALASATRFIYVFVRGVGETVGHWIRVLQPTAPAPEPPQTLEQMVGGLPARRRQDDDHVYRAVAEVAAALAAGQAPRAAVAQMIDNDTHEWLSLLSPGEVNLVSQLSPATLRGHLTGRLRVPALLRMARGEMTERAEQLVRPRVIDETQSLIDADRPALAAGI